MPESSATFAPYRRTFTRLFRFTERIPSFDTIPCITSYAYRISFFRDVFLAFASSHPRHPPMSHKRAVSAECSSWGYFWMVANCCTTAGYVLYMKHATKTIKLPRFGMVFYNNLLTTLLLTVAAFMVGDFKILFNTPQLHTFTYISTLLFSGETFLRRFPQPREMLSILYDGRVQVPPRMLRDGFYRSVFW